MKKSVHRVAHDLTVWIKTMFFCVGDGSAGADKNVAQKTGAQCDGKPDTISWCIVIEIFAMKLSHLSASDEVKRELLSRASVKLQHVVHSIGQIRAIEEQIALLIKDEYSGH